MKEHDTPVAARPHQRIGRVSIVIPMRNEARHVPRLVDDLAHQDYDGELEVIVADGASIDGSAALLEAHAEKAGLALTVVDNPEQAVSTGLNRCIALARGDLIIRMDCHSRFPDNYVRRCVEAAEETDAWNVGGRVVPHGETAMERAVAAAMNSPFGGIGWTRHGGSPERVEVDTVTFGAFRPHVFSTVGLFDETLVRDQDDELNFRIRRAGGRIVLDPSIVTHYTPRGTWRGVFRQYFEYGLWKVAVMRKHRAVLGARSLAPVAFVGSTAALALAATVSRRSRFVFGAEAAAYTAGATAFGVLALRRHEAPARLLPRVMATFAAFHIGYGSGMAAGIARNLRHRSARAR